MAQEHPLKTSPIEELEAHFLPLEFNPSPAESGYMSEEANWSGSAPFSIKYVNLYQYSGSSYLIGWKLDGCGILIIQHGKGWHKYANTLCEMYSFNPSFQIWCILETCLYSFVAFNITVLSVFYLVQFQVYTSSYISIFQT